MTHKLNTQENEQEKKIAWAFSILSDAQEEISIGRYNQAQDKINDAKRVLMGKFAEQEDGMSIAIIRGRIQPSQEQTCNHSERQGSYCEHCLTGTSQEQTQ